MLRLFDDDDVTKRAGIYPYVLTRDERHLNIRSFSKAVKQRVYNRQNGKCAECDKAFDLPKMEADHITPWSDGGKTIEEIVRCYARSTIGGKRHDDVQSVSSQQNTLLLIVGFPNDEIQRHNAVVALISGIQWSSPQVISPMPSETSLIASLPPHGINSSQETRGYC